MKPADMAVFARAATLRGDALAAASCWQSALTLGADPVATRKHLITCYETLGLSDWVRTLAGELSTSDADPKWSRLAQLPPTAPGADPLLSYGVNEVQRWRTLAAPIVDQGARRRVLDVGGGRGGLHLFLPGHHYVLAEPTVNKLRGGDLPFADQEFDVVVSCHVLEHVAPEERSAFLDEMLRLTRRRIVILNPVAHPSLDERPRLELIVRLTGAAWAKEHLECGLPPRSMISDWAADRGLTCEARPSGNIPLGLALVMVDHYALLAGRPQEAILLRQYFNGQLAQFLDSPTGAGSWLYVIDRPQDPTS